MAGVLELDLQAVMNLLTQVLGTKHGPCARLLLYDTRQCALSILTSLWLPLLDFKLYLFLCGLCMCAYVYAYHNTRVEVSEQFARVGSFFLPCGSWGWAQIVRFSRR